MKIILAILLSLLSVSCLSQITGLEVEVVYVDDGTFEQYPDNGITYRIYVTMANEDDFLSAIYGFTEGEDCSEGDADILLATTTNFFQYETIGGWSGESQTCILFDLFPSAQYDSFVTIGVSCQGGGNTFAAMICPPESDAIAIFEGPVNGDYNDGGNWLVEDGAVFITMPEVTGFAGEDLKVLVAQLTSNGTVYGHFYAQVIIAKDLTDEQFLSFNLVPGCTNPEACNFIPDAEYDNGSCGFSCYGCTDEFACNFDPDATLEDNSCEYGSSENDNIESAITLENLVLTDCQTFNHCLNSDSPEWPEHLDSWFIFSANFETTELTISSEYNDIQIALLDSDFEIILEVDETTDGAEMLSLSDLIPNANYYLGIASDDQSGVLEICSDAIAFEGDLNGDGFINIDDLLDLLGQLGCEPFCPGDLDGDGLVTILDLLIILGALGGP